MSSHVSQLCGRTIRVDHVENYRLPKNLQEKEEQQQSGGDPTQAGQAYQGQELANKFSLQKGQDLFAPPQNDGDSDDEAKKEAKRMRKEERQRKRDEKEKRKREKERRRSDKEERKREKRARNLQSKKDRHDDHDDDERRRHSKERRYDSDDSSH